MTSRGDEKRETLSLLRTQNGIHATEEGRETGGVRRIVEGKDDDGEREERSRNNTIHRFSQI